MRHALVLMGQVTFPDVRNAVAPLDVRKFLRQTATLLPYAPDIPIDEDTRLVRALVEIPFGDGVTPAERLAPYTQVGVADEWCRIILKLRVRGSSALAHPEAMFGGEYIFDDDRSLVPAGRLLGARQRLLRPRARTLGVVLERSPGASELARVPPPPDERTSDTEFDAMVAELDKRVRPTVGGDAFLAPDPEGRALSVLAATVAAVLGDRSSQRWAGTKRVVRADTYRALFDALALEKYFDVAREVLERDHPHRRELYVPWPPGEPVVERDLGILTYQDGYLTLSPGAVLPSLPLLQTADGEGREEQ
jgi:hypothetical protein